VWRLKAEEWEEKYKVAIETEARKWERADRHVADAL
jgi:hypothetical protein